MNYYAGDAALIEAAAAELGAAVTPEKVFALRPMRELFALAANLRTGCGFDPDAILAEAERLHAVLKVACAAADRLIGHIHDCRGLPDLPRPGGNGDDRG